MLDRARVASHAMLVAVCLATVLPFWWMLSTSLKSANVVFDLSPLPTAPTFENYVQMWRAIPMASMLVNTFLNAGLLMVGQVIVATMAAYAFARWRFRGDNLLLVLFVGTWLVPFQVTMLPNYVLLSRLGWLDTLAALVVPHLGSAFAVIMLRQFMKSFPLELVEAARLDGAGSWAILWRMMVPNLRAPLATLAILSFISTWNEYFWPLLVTSRPDRTVVQVGLQMFLSSDGEQWGPLMAAATVATVPVLLVYVLFQRQVVEAFVRSGLR
ncbi:MAG: carbohydrate ABC transporter permease [Chloroflexi bacterium]|nr:carbohydrate ABC transporter permease [Chloroflexota bacterium]MBV9896180.1 carbohydrate ABC transporter permease [Chloroflexota bacterium]